MNTMMELRARDLNPAQILSACQSWVPVNASVDPAIHAHKDAYRCRDKSPGGVELAARALRAVILAAALDVTDCQQQLDYLAALPDDAWEGLGSRPRCETRHATLAALSRSITWRAER